MALRLCLENKTSSASFWKLNLLKLIGKGNDEGHKNQREKEYRRLRRPQNFQNFVVDWTQIRQTVKMLFHRQCFLFKNFFR